MNSIYLIHDVVIPKHLTKYPADRIRFLFKLTVFLQDFALAHLPI